MRMALRGGLALALCLGLGFVEGRAQSPAPTTGDDLSTFGTTDPQYRAWAGKSAAHRIQQQKQFQAEKEAREKHAPKGNAQGGNARGGAAPAEPSSLFDDRQKEQNAYLRRLDVCNKLMEIAVQTNDAGMQRQIEQLETQAFALLRKRTGLSTALPGETKQDEQMLDAKLGPKATESGVLLPPPPNNRKSTSTVVRTEGKP